eukprot:scaffold176218_cov30-Attheya_sp.AAC.1
MITTIAGFSVRGGLVEVAAAPGAGSTRGVKSISFRLPLFLDDIGAPEGRVYCLPFSGSGGINNVAHIAFNFARPEVEASVKTAAASSIRPVASRIYG